MFERLPVHLAAGLMAFAALGASGIALAKPVQLDAEFDAHLGGFTFGSMNMRADFDGDRYKAASVIRTEGIADVVFKQIFDLKSQGARGTGGMRTADYKARNTDQDDIQHIHVVYDEGGAPAVVADPPYDNSSRVPSSASQLMGTVDPLTSLLVPVATPGPEACNRVIPVYDGRRRYDFRLSFEGISQIDDRDGYAGPAARCAARLEPISGYKRETIRDMRRDPLPITLWLGAVEGADVLVPVRLEIATPLGTLLARATRFDVSEGAGSQASLIAP